MQPPKFHPGEVYATPGALEASGGNLLAVVLRHAAGDWGIVDDEDKQTNDEALKNGARLLSAYMLPSGVKVWVLTEAVNARGKRWCTTVLLPSEY